MNELFFIADYVAKPHSEMKRSGIELRLAEFQRAPCLHERARAPPPVSYTHLSSDDLPLDSKNELLSALSAVAYGKENGFEIRVEEGYMELQQMLIRRFTIEKEEKNE